MITRYPPARLRRTSDQPTAITNVLAATAGSSYRTGEIPLGTPTCSARSRHGLWALCPGGGVDTGPRVRGSRSLPGWRHAIGPRFVSLLADREPAKQSNQQGGRWT